MVATRPTGENGLGMSSISAAAELDRIKKMFVFLPDRPETFKIWESLVKEHRVMGKPAHDARLVAGMKVHGLSSVLTFDRKGYSRFPGIKMVHPDDLLEHGARSVGEGLMGQVTPAIWIYPSTCCTLLQVSGLVSMQ